MTQLQESKKTDILIIGAGPGGYVAAIYAAKKGKKVILVDKARVGGTCLNVGCIPTKAMIQAVNHFYDAQHGHTYGIQVDHVTADLEAIIRHKDDITRSLTEGIIHLLEKHQVTLLNGKARFVSDKVVQVDTEDGIIQIEPEHIIIATGAKTKHLPFATQKSERILDSEQLLSLKKMPQKMIIIGAGIIGMEFAFIFGRLGCEVRVLEFLPRILPTVDKDLSQRLLRFAKEANIQITTQAQVTGIQDRRDHIEVTYIEKEQEKTLSADIVLEAIGRIPETQDLGLENTQIALNPNGGIRVNHSMQTHVEGIYAIGDVTHIIQLAHVASHQALVAVDHILGLDHPMDYEAIPSVIFTTPEIAVTGKTEIELEREGIAYHTHKVPFSASGKALIQNNQFGFIKLIYHPETKALLGASVFGEDAQHLIAPLTMAIKHRLSFEAIKDTIFAHPTLSELIHEGAMGVLGEAIHYLG
ncbi:MAG: dihydrolipoyl dehydrogenase [Candidatus Izemoplasmatales bacterium]|nr:dihydrolipoyl dehydrogenase [Candidatus Izemoplasmatales bacterium]